MLYIVESDYHDPIPFDADSDEEAIQCIERDGTDETTALYGQTNNSAKMRLVKHW